MLQDAGRFGQLAMTSEEMIAFLGSAEQAVLSSLRRNGAPFAVPLGFYCDGEDFYVTFGRDRGAVKRLRHDPRVSLTVPSTHAYPTKFVIIEGTAEEVPDPDHEISRAVFSRNGGREKWEARGVDPDRFFTSWVAVGRVVFRIHVANLITFDGTKTPKHEKYGLGTRLPTDPVPSS